MGCGVSTTTNHKDGGDDAIIPHINEHHASSNPHTDPVDEGHREQISNEVSPSENKASLEEEAVDTATNDLEEMGSSLPPFPAKVSKYKRRFPGHLEGAATYDEDATPSCDEVPGSGNQNSSVGGLSTVLNGFHPVSGGEGGGGVNVPSVPHMGPFSHSHCEETSTSTGPNTPMSMSSSHRSGRRRGGAKRTSCDGRPMLFKSVLDGGAESSPSSNPLGRISASQSGDASTRSRTNTVDAGGEDSEVTAFATFGGMGGSALGGKQQSSSFTTNPSSPSNAHPPTDNFSPHSPFFTGNSSNNNQRAPKGWERVNVARNASVDSNLDTSSVLGSSMKSSINQRGRPSVCGGTKSLPSIDQSPHSLTLVPATSVANGSSSLPPIQNERKRESTSVVASSSSVVVHPSDKGKQRRSSKVRHGGGRLPMTLMSSSSESLESLLLSDTELQHGVDEVFASSAHFVPAAAQPVPSPGGSPLISPSLMRSTTSNGTHTTDDHHIIDAATGTPPPPPHRTPTNDTLAFGANSETHFPREIPEGTGMRRSSFPAVVSPGLPPVAPPSCGNHVPPRNHRLPSTDATNMFYGGGKRMSESSGTTTVNNHSIALTDVSIGRGGWGMSSSTTSVSQIKESPQLF